MKLKLFFIMYLALSFVGCTKKNALTNEDIKQIIIKMNENVRTTLRNGDPNYVLNMHTQDAIQFLPNGTEVVGIAALTSFYEKIASLSIDIKSTTISIERLTDDTVFEVGTFTSTLKSGIQNSGKYIIIWKKIGENWKIYKAIDQAKL
jgi:ketosteroid isomerase-like protein